MKLDIFSHCTIDTIQINDSKYVVPGGPACYCSLTARILKFDVDYIQNLVLIFNLLTILLNKKLYLKMRYQRNLQHNLY